MVILKGNKNKKVRKILFLVMMFSVVVLAACGKKCSPSSEWSFDDFKHWHECEKGDKDLDVANHKFTWHVETVATCKVALVEEGVCICGYTTTRTGSKLEHKMEVLVGVAPTCTETGLTDGIKCLVCDEVLLKQGVIPALGHTEVIDEAVAATCTEAGLTEGSHCSVCNEVLIAQTVVPALGHTNVEVKENNVAPTCLDSGSYELVVSCSVCNIEISRETIIVPALGHTIVIDEAIEATCTLTGLTEGSHCSVCEVVLVPQEILPALGHTIVVDEAIEATCTLPGLTEGSHCSVCEVVLVPQEIILALGHTIVIDEAVVPTCTETGLKEGSHCSVCEEILIAQEIISALGHTEVIDEAIEATCTETGLTEGSHCSVCDVVLVAQEIAPALGHTNGEVVKENDILPTCILDGSYQEVIYCKVCNIELSRETVVVPALGHTEVIDAAIEATCTETGLTEGSHCSVCKEVLVPQTVVDALGHTEVVDAAVEATCEDAGLTEGAHCSVCSEILVPQTVVAALGHTEVIDIAIEPECIKTGLTEGKHCSVCNEVIIAQEIVPALGHDITNTYYEEQNGIMMLVEICSRCGILTTEVDVTKPVKVNNYNDLVTILNAGYDTLITESLDMPTGIDISKDVNLTIASGVTITLKNDTMGLGAFRATNGATLTIDSKGIIDGVGNNNYNMAIWANSGNVIINSGTYTNVGAIDDGTGHFDLIYASNGGSVIINGGTFIAETPKWTLNLKDNDLVAKITVYGGTFKEYDPANSKTESASANTNFVADGHLSLLNANGYYTVYKQTSIAEALVIGGGKAHNAYTSEKYVLAGTITKIDNTQYGNMYIKDSEGKEIYIYGLYSDDGKVRYDSMSYKPVAGDIIIVNGVLGKYNSSVQMKSGWLISCTAHTHNFTEATCSSPKTCELCKVTEGEALPHTDLENDHACDICEAKVGKHEDITGDSLCEYCGEEALEETIVTLAEFTFGANKGAAHVDGADLGKTKAYTADGYTLNLNYMSKVFAPSYDAKGNSCIKLGSSVIGSLKFTVEDNVTEVIIYVAQYKSNATQITVNGISYTITTASNNGAYTEIKIDTTTIKTISFSTASGGVRCMINSIVYNGYNQN